jgi:hypothetical protein
MSATPAQTALAHPVQLGRTLQLLTSSSPDAGRKGTIGGFSDLPY